MSEQRLAEGESAQKYAAEQYVNDGRLDLDEMLILQDECRAAEDHHDDGGHDRHHGKMARQRIIDRKRNEYRRYEYGRRRKYAGVLTGEQFGWQERREERRETAPAAYSRGRTGPRARNRARS